MTDLLLASRAHKTKTNYNFYIKNRILHWGRHIRSIYGFLWPENVNFYPTCSMRKKESMVQLQLHTLPFQLFCPLSYSAKINRQTFTFRKYYNLPILKNLGSKIEIVSKTIEKNGPTLSYYSFSISYILT